LGRSGFERYAASGKTEGLSREEETAAFTNILRT
jgi:hypothetical protein